MAEVVLSNAVLQAFLHRNEWRERMSFREGVLRAVWEEAEEQLRREPDGDWDWTGLTRDLEGDHPLIDIMSTEPPEAQRTMVLRFGCSLTAKEIALLTGRTAEQVREQLSRCQARAERELQKKEVSFKPFERYAAKEIRLWMNRDGGEAIDSGYFLAAFERDASGAREPRRIAAKMVKGFFMALGALLTAVIFWLIAVLLEM